MFKPEGRPKREEERGGGKEVPFSPFLKEEEKTRFFGGFWADDLDQPDRSVTFIVFETLDQARGFREAVMANAPAQADVGVERGELRIVEVRADA